MKKSKERAKKKPRSYKGLKEKLPQKLRRKKEKAKEAKKPTEGGGKMEMERALDNGSKRLLRPKAKNPKKKRKNKGKKTRESS